jgi:hypothetical protein
MTLWCVPLAHPTLVCQGSLVLTSESFRFPWKQMLVWHKHGVLIFFFFKWERVPSLTAFLAKRTQEAAGSQGKELPLVGEDLFCSSKQWLNDMLPPLFQIQTTSKYIWSIQLANFTFFLVAISSFSLLGLSWFPFLPFLYLLFSVPSSSSSSLTPPPPPSPLSFFSSLIFLLSSSSNRLQGSNVWELSSCLCLPHYDGLDNCPLKPHVLKAWSQPKVLLLDSGILKRLGVANL